MGDRNVDDKGEWSPAAPQVSIVNHEATEKKRAKKEAEKDLVIRDNELVILIWSQSYIRKYERTKITN